MEAEAKEPFIIQDAMTGVAFLVNPQTRCIQMAYPMVKPDGEVVEIFTLCLN